MPSFSAVALLAAKADFQSALLGWYRANARPLPWRESPTLYKTVVSELMLQQTQVKTALPYFERWMLALPDFAALASATEARVLKLWEGLGYYSRARNLHRLAQALVSRAAPPRAPEDWRELPGVGPYTAAAITSIAFDAPAACVDGNVVRILARLTGDDTEFRDSGSAAKAFGPLANSLLTRESPGDHNQAMMELGATVCLRHKPNCAVCPVRGYCRATKLDNPERLPRLLPKKIERMSVARIWCEDRGRLLLQRAGPAARRLQDMHELPAAADLGIDPVGKSIALAKKTRAITRFHITETIYAVAAGPAIRRHLAGRRAGLQWVPIERLDQITLSGPHRRWVTQILAARS